MQQFSILIILFKICFAELLQKTQSKTDNNRQVDGSLSCTFPRTSAGLAIVPVCYEMQDKSVSSAQGS